jgi:chromosomal replication initiation ATPase DnaA
MSTLRERLEAAGVLETCERICAGYGSTLEVCEASRQKTKTLARHHCWMVIRHTLDLSLPEIGQLWGRDHTTVLQGIRKAEAQLERVVAA